MILELLGALAALLLSLVAYSAGSVAPRRSRSRRPGVADLALAAACAAAAVWARGVLGHWAGLAAGIGGSGAVGLAASLWTATGAADAVGSPQAADAGDRGAMARWRRLAMVLGDFQGRLFMAFLYFLVLAPVGLATRVLSDPLDVGPAERESWWRQREQPPGETVEDLRRQA